MQTISPRIHPAIGAIIVGLVSITVSGCADGNKSGNMNSEKSEAAFLRAGDMALAQNDPGQAAELYRRAAEVAPDDAAPYNHLGDALAKAGILTEAFEAYRGALARDADNFETTRKLGKLALSLGRPQQAIGYLEAARKQHNDDATIWSALGVAHDSMGDHLQAQSDYQTAMKLAPDNLTIKNNFGLSQILAGNFHGAIATLTAVVADPRATAQNRQNLALVYGLVGNTPASLAASKDLSEDDRVSNQQYYALLRGMDDRARSQAILRNQFGSAVAPASNQAPPPQ